MTNCFNSENIIFKMELFASANRVVVEAKMEEEIADSCHSVDSGSSIHFGLNLGQQTGSSLENGYFWFLGL